MDHDALLQCAFEERAHLKRCVVPLFADVCIIDEVMRDGSVQPLDGVFADRKSSVSWNAHIRRFAPRPGWKTPQVVVIEGGRPSCSHGGRSHALAHVARASCDAVLWIKRCRAWMVCASVMSS
jgi:hypothetical protein